MEKNEVKNCPTCGTLCSVVQTCHCGESGCDGSPKLIPRLKKIDEEAVMVMDIQRKCNLGYGRAADVKEYIVSQFGTSLPSRKRVDDIVTVMVYDFLSINNVVNNIEPQKRKEFYGKLSDAIMKECK